MKQYEIGRLLRAGTTGFVVGCRAAQIDAPSFGALVRVSLDGDYQVYGLIHDIHIDDDGLVRQLVTAEGVDEAVIADNRVNRNVPLELSVLTVGYRLDGKISHLLPPRPPLSLDVIYLCSAEEVRQSPGAGGLGIFDTCSVRLIYRSESCLRRTYSRPQRRTRRQGMWNGRMRQRKS